MGDRCDTFTIWRCLKLINIAPFKGTYYYICKKMSVKYLSHLSHLSPQLKISGVVHLSPDWGSGFKVLGGSYDKGVMRREL